uniref:Uncharacterized protein n=1 Tax=Streptomyces sp. NBC_01401 TaxID=2903854 RepID=A0AAU3GZ86_9ACTN
MFMTPRGGRPAEDPAEDPPADPVNDGFCQVGSRPPNPASATTDRPESMARWIGGRPVHAAAATTAGTAPAASDPPPDPAGPAGPTGPAGAV